MTTSLVSRRQISIWNSAKLKQFLYKHVFCGGNYYGAFSESATDWEKLVLFLGKNGWARRRIDCNLPAFFRPILWKSVTDFEKIRNLLCGNPLPILGQSVIDSATSFGEICRPFCETPFSGKTLVKICAVFSKKRALVAGKTGSMLGKTCSVLGENRPRFWEYLGQNGSVLVKNRLGLREIGLVFGLACDKAQVSLFWTPSMFGFGCH